MRPFFPFFMVIWFISIFDWPLHSLHIYTYIYLYKIYVCIHNINIIPLIFRRIAVRYQKWHLVSRYMKNWHLFSSNWFNFPYSTALHYSILCLSFLLFSILTTIIFHIHVKYKNARKESARNRGRFVHVKILIQMANGWCRRAQHHLIICYPLMESTRPIE